MARRLSECCDDPRRNGAGGMPQTSGGKLFAGLYALYSGLAVLIVAGIVFAPLLHRLMHRLHWDTNDS